VRAELSDAEQRLDQGLEIGKLPEKLLRTKAWDRSREQLRKRPGLGPLCAQLDSAYAEVKRVGMIRSSRMWVAYTMEPGDGVEEALASIRGALDALEAMTGKMPGSGPASGSPG